MGLTRQEILDRASRYLEPGAAIDFAHEGDVFCLLMREIPTDRVLQEEEGWNFRGYGLCIGYELDEESKPLGKWLWMHFASLDSFPPVSQVLKLQPPHVVKGRFQNPERSHEFRILRVSVSSALQTLDQLKDKVPGKQTPASQSKPAKKSAKPREEKIVQFRPKK